MHPRSIKGTLRILAFTSTILLMFASCIPQKEIVYFQNHEDKKGYDNPYDTPKTITEKYILQPNDALLIRVNTANPKLSEFFNAGGSNQNVAATGQSPLYTYPIDDSLYIDFPFVGKIRLDGCTRAMATERIREALIPFVNDAQVTVRLANPSFVALGEVNNRGRIPMGREQVTIFEAVAMAGDVRPFGKKREVRVVRPTPEGSISFFVDLTDKNLVDSDKYYIYPNDIVYIRPMKAKQWGIGESFSFGVFSSMLAMYLTLNAIFGK
ncbi:polysaccharide biosynthesis/export family protein [Xiashengella succiniciproducens]|uniref:Polysaccharide biosynthesis/export family protein n=1 Tax=Xiashengella succiniciproducens TaxID=2949635 RepID=A0A9J6ZLI7_9BACT|nr:polysaccharide biosynthesis/export family protein [Alkaliflexus sp. Ai-910]URW78716.1 polysaccharide biosynthesis/export family protein [Alkaliflexus sp. Ai-910]